MEILVAVASFGVVAGLLTIVPGADTALVLRTAIARGRAHAFAAAAGISSGCLFWGAAAATGVSMLLTASRTAYTVLRIAGAIYLCYLGVRLLYDAFRKRHNDLGVHDLPPGSPWRSWLTGFFNNLLNPKVGVFYIAMLPQFLPQGVPALPMGVLLALVHFAQGMVWFAIIIGGVGLSRRWLRGGTPSAIRIRRTFDAVTGTVLVGLGIKLAATP